MSIWVRRTDGIITGLYPRVKSGIAEEELPDNHPDVVAFLAAPAAAKAAAEARVATFKAEGDVVGILDKLKTATPAQIGTWIDNSVTSLADARTVLKAIVKAMALLARQMG